MRVPFRLVDVFTSRPLAGNQLCVVPEPGDLDERMMLALAQEVGFSETTYVTEAGGDRYTMRIFTPDSELPFAGHPTLGTAFVLAGEGRISSTATQVVAAGEIPVEVDVATGFAWMTQLPPELGPAFEDRELLSRATGLAVDDLREDVPAMRASTGLPALIVPVTDLETLRRARIDQRFVAVACERSISDELYLFALGPGDDVTARFFGPTIGILEDPATGSAAGPLGVYLAEHGLAGMPGSLIVHQGEQVGRPSELHVEVAAEGDSWRVRVGGGVHLVGEGTFRL